MLLLKCCGLQTECFTRTGGIPRHLPIITGPGMLWFMIGCTTMPTETFFGFLAGASSQQPCCVCSLSLLWFMSMRLAFALDFSTQFSSSSLCVLACFLISFYMTVGKVPFGMWSCGHPYFWVRGSSSVCIPRNGTPSATVQSTILPSLISWNHVLGLVVSSLKISANRMMPLMLPRASTFFTLVEKTAALLHLDYVLMYQKWRCSYCLMFLLNESWIIIVWSCCSSFWASSYGPDSWTKC